METLDPQSDQKIDKNLANIWKCSQNCRQNIKAQIESPKPLLCLKQEQLKH
jgi:hypothetical protein